MVDDPIVLETSAAIVRSFGFSVRTAEDGFIALQILREALPGCSAQQLPANRSDHSECAAAKQHQAGGFRNWSDVDGPRARVVMVRGRVV